MQVQKIQVNLSTCLPTTNVKLKFLVNEETMSLAPATTEITFALGDIVFNKSDGKIPFEVMVASDGTTNLNASAVVSGTQT